MIPEFPRKLASTRMAMREEVRRLDGQVATMFTVQQWLAPRDHAEMARTCWLNGERCQIMEWTGARDRERGALFVLKVGRPATAVVDRPAYVYGQYVGEEAVRTTVLFEQTITLGAHESAWPYVDLEADT
jgi:hypothetical protein